MLLLLEPSVDRYPVQCSEIIVCITPLIPQNILENNSAKRSPRYIVNVNTRGDGSENHGDSIR